MREDEARVTADDVIELNRETLARTATMARIAGTGLVLVGAVGVAAWLWILLRQQRLVGDGGGFFGFSADDANPSFKERVDVFAGSVGYLVSVALTAGFGLALRMIGEYMTSRTGGSLTSAEIGDFLPEAEEEGDDEPL